ncbi:hypothetical protein B4U80_11984, partial [Leptotrombidium deliense]
MNDFLSFGGFLCLLLLFSNSKTKVDDGVCPSCDILKLKKTTEDTEPIESVDNEVLMDNFFSKTKKYSSKVFKIRPKQGKSWNVYPGMKNNKADIHIMNHTFTHLFSKQRNYFFDLKHKEKIRSAILQLFQTFGFKVEVQKFTAHSRIQRRGRLTEIEGRNLIGILQSDTYGKVGDRIIVVGAHYDTVYVNPGIEDNGSGSVLVLETARLLSQYAGRLNASIYFILFDQEESGLEGSLAFVREYFVPKIIEKQKAEYVGAFITDMCLTYDPEPNSQQIPRDFPTMVPEAADWISNNSFRGDFISIWARNADSFLGYAFQDAWNTLEPTQEYKLLLVRPPIEANAYNVPREHFFSMFYRSDHASFWSSALHNNETE